ncbi:hypothetical protein [Streptomyces sp. NPDC093589]
MALSARITRRIERDFPQDESAVWIELAHWGWQQRLDEEFGIP